MIGIETGVKGRKGKGAGTRREEMDWERSKVASSIESVTGIL